MFSLRLFPLLLVFGMLVHCGNSSPATTDNGPNTDTVPPVDSVLPTDQSPEDPGASVDESTLPDLGAPLPDLPVPQDIPVPINGSLETAFGTIEGGCGLLGPEIMAPTPSFFVSTYTFHDGYIFNIDDFASGPQARFSGGNAGGSSGCSEVISMQVFIDCENAVVLKTENEIQYQTEGKKTDYIAQIDGLSVGVSVTRAYKGPITEYSLEDAVDLLEKKLEGVNESSLNVHPDDAWVKQILHIWTLHPEWAETVEQAWSQMSEELRADTIVVVSVEQNSTVFVTDICAD